MSAGIRRTLFLVLIASLVAFSGCGGGGGGTSSLEGTPPPGSGETPPPDSGETPPPGSAGTPLAARVLSWVPPTAYVDATSMNPVTDLDRFEIFLNDTGSFTDADTPMAAVSAVDPASHTLSTSFDLANLSPHVTAGPRYYVSLRAVALTGMKSEFSPPVTFSF